MSLFDEVISDTITEDQFYEKVFAKTKSQGTLDTVRTRVRAFDYFCDHKYKMKKEQVLEKIKELSVKSGHSKHFVKLVNEYAIWLTQDHPDYLIDHHVSTRVYTRKKALKKKGIGTIKNYLSVLRVFSAHVFGIEVSPHIWKDVSIPLPTDDFDDDSDNDDVEPFSIEELTGILDSTKDPRVKAWMMFMKCTTARPWQEAGQIRKKDIDFTTNPPTVTFPKNMVKGKVSKRVNYLDVETTPRIKMICKDIDDDDPVFRRKEVSLSEFTQNTRRIFNRVKEKLAKDDPVLYGGLIKKKSNGYYEKTAHSFRKFATTKYEDANNESMMHAYSGHLRYLPTYSKKTHEQKIQMFRKFEQLILIYQKTEIIDSSIVNQQLEKKLNNHDLLLRNIITIIYNDPEIMTILKKKGLDENLLQLQN